MKTRFAAWMLALLCMHRSLPGAFEELPSGARSVALGMSGTSMDGRIDYMFINPACLATLTHWQASLYATRPFGISELSFQTLSAGFPFFKGGIGLTVQSFGARHYHEQQIGLNWATRVERRFTLGLRLRAGRIQIARYGSTLAWIVDWGILFRPAPKFQLGASLSNLLQARIGSGRELLPQTLRLGLQFSVLEPVLLSMDLIKDTRFPVRTVGGVEIRVLPTVCFRAGFSSRPDYLCGGFGIRFQSWHLDYGYAIHPVLGGTHHITLLFLDGKR